MNLGIWLSVLFLLFVGISVFPPALLGVVALVGFCVLRGCGNRPRAKKPPAGYYEYTPGMYGDPNDRRW